LVFNIVEHFQEVPGFGSANVPNNLRQFNLVLIHSSTKGNNIMCLSILTHLIVDNQALEVLNSRTEDKEAQKFISEIRVCY
jgi:hypothetical protein